jgi:hypothetical protein
MYALTMTADVDLVIVPMPAMPYPRNAQNEKRRATVHPCTPSVSCRATFAALLIATMLSNGKQMMTNA